MIKALHSSRTIAIRLTAPPRKRARSALTVIKRGATRRYQERKWALTIPNADVPSLLFGQQHVETQDYFREKVGSSHTVRLDQTAHFAVATGAPSGEHDYLDYLEQSWNYYKNAGSNIEEARRLQLARFKNNLSRLRSAAEIDKPVHLFERPDGRRVIIDGNHRASIAYALGLDLPAVLVPASDALKDIVDNKREFYGSGNRDMPYQSLYWNERELLRGRRVDMLERIEMMDSSDLVGASVLDLGCNVGSNCFIATQHGAISALGVELSPAIATSAIRLNSFYGLPCTFRSHDLTTVLTGERPFDVVFCLSVVAHLPSVEGIVQTIRDLTGKVLYFECHSNRTRNDYEYILNSDYFSSIELIGVGRESIQNPRRNRPLYRCVV